MHTQFTIDQDGIAHLELNHNQHHVNVLDQQMINEVLEHFHEVITNNDVVGLLISSAKKSFIAGVDLSLLGAIDQKEPAEFRDFLMRIHQAMIQLETSSKPVVTVINGTTLGGGLELALCANHIIGHQDKPAQIGFPEIRLGIFPGMGGSVRAPRLIGLQHALEMIFKGKIINMNQAHQLGLIHQLSSDPITDAKIWIKNHPHATHPCYDEKNLRSLNPYHPKSTMIFAAANQLIRKDTWDCYPNAQFALQTIYESLQLPMPQALQIEANYFTDILFRQNSQAIIKTLFIDKKRLDKGAHSPLPVEKTFHKIGIVGAGFMGAEIAYACLSRGMEVNLIDIKPEILEKAKETITNLNEKALRYQKTSTATNILLGKLITSCDYDGLLDCQLVIEAVFEDRAIKKSTLEKIDLAVSDQTIIASNTSTLPISSLAEYVSGPHRFLGIHFFSPVHKMQLVELIYGEKTNDHTMACAIDFVKKINKTSITVQDGRGFFTTRVVISYLSEGMRLLKEGVAPAMIENAGKAIGMPVGPLALADEIALDLAYKIRKQTIIDEGSNWQDDGIGEVLNFMVEEQQRLGRKSKAGFYDYSAQNEKKLWAGLSHFQTEQSALGFDVIKDRLLFRQLIEVKNLVSEGIIIDPAQINVGAILGFGFCPWTGGPMAYLKQIGTTTLNAKSATLTKNFGHRFTIK